MNKLNTNLKSEPKLNSLFSSRNNTILKRKTKFTKPQSGKNKFSNNCLSKKTLYSNNSNSLPDYLLLLSIFLSQFEEKYLKF